MESKQQSGFARWKEKHASLWQFVMFMLMSGITTLVDLGVFSLLNFWLLTPLRDRAFHWWLIDYSLPNGGMTAFLAFAISFAVSQTFNFFLQRKTTFKATTNVVKSGIQYAVMVLGTYFVQLYLPTLIREPIVALVGAVLGDLAVKLINMTVSMLIQFPINKWIIMRDDTKKESK